MTPLRQATARFRSLARVFVIRRAYASQEADPFTAQLQRKTERELLELFQRNAKEGAHPEVAVAELTAEAEEEPEPAVSPTGEVDGPRGATRGAEPTRYGDWERGGRCYDF